MRQAYAIKKERNLTVKDLLHEPNEDQLHGSRYILDYMERAENFSLYFGDYSVKMFAQVCETFELNMISVYVKSNCPSSLTLVVFSIIVINAVRTSSIEEW